MKDQETLLVILERKLHVPVTENKVLRQSHKNGMTYVNHLFMDSILLNCQWSLEK